MKALSTGHGTLRLPAFLPDATKGVVRTVDSADLAEVGVEGIVVNVLHLSSHPGASVVMMARPVASDSSTARGVPSA